MLLDVGNTVRSRLLSILVLAFLLFFGATVESSLQSPAPTQQPSIPSQPQATPSTPAPQSAIPGAVGAQLGLQQSGLNIVVLDPAHGGTDTGARGTGGIRESEIVLDLASEVRRALESQGIQVVQTRQGNDNPSFDDRSAIANAQRGAVFVALHISSTGLPGTVRVYVNSDLPALTNANGLIPWDHAQAPYLSLSKKFGDLVQSALAQRFKGSPDSAQIATVRQLRTTAEPAIAVEISSVVVNDRADLDRMAPGVAEAIARGAASFKPLYIVPALAGAQP